MTNNFSHQLSLIDLFKLSLRVFRTKPLRTFLTILGMSFGIGTVLILVSLGYGLQYVLIGKLVSTEDSLITLEASYPAESELNISYNDIKIISALNEVSEISPVAEFTGEIKYEDQTGLNIIKIVRPNYFRLSGQIPDIGETFLETEPAVVISKSAAELIGIYQNLPKDGNGEVIINPSQKMSFNISYQNEGEFKTEETETKELLAIKGIAIDELQPPFVFIPEEFVVKKPPFFKKILIKAKDIDNVEPLKDKLIEKGFLISARIDLVKQATKVMNIITIVLGVFGVAALVVAAVGMFNTMIVSFLERIYEVGIIKSLGATDRDVRDLFLMESLVMGFLGGVGGIIMGIGAGEAANFALNLLAKRFGGKPFDIFITPLWFIILIIVSSSLIGVLSGLWPARRATYLSPKEAFVRK